jgi:hypothetical protein
VISLVYNNTMSSAEKRAVKEDFIGLVRAGCTKHPGSMALRDVTAGTPAVDWRNWLYFGALEGRNGWQPLVEMDDYYAKMIKTPSQDHPEHPTPGDVLDPWLEVTNEFPSRRWALTRPRSGHLQLCSHTSLILLRFRLRLMGVGGEASQQKVLKFVMVMPWELIDKSTGKNIVGEGEGYIKALGELPIHRAEHAVTGGMWQVG